MSQGWLQEDWKALLQDISINSPSFLLISFVPGIFLVSFILGIIRWTQLLPPPHTLMVPYWSSRNADPSPAWQLSSFFCLTEYSYSVIKYLISTLWFLLHSHQCQPQCSLFTLLSLAQFAEISLACCCIISQPVGISFFSFKFFLKAHFFRAVVTTLPLPFYYYLQAL